MKSRPSSVMEEELQVELLEVCMGSSKTSCRRQLFFALIEICVRFIAPLHTPSKSNPSIRCMVLPQQELANMSALDLY